MRRRTLLFMGAALSLGIGTLALVPGQYRAWLHTAGRLHSTMHFVAFFGISLLLLRGTRSKKAHALLIAIAILLGIGTEFVEHRLYHAPLEYKDIVFDLCGILSGWLTAATLKQARRRKLLQRKGVL